MSTADIETAEGYDGPVTLRAQGEDASVVEADARIRGHFEPIDGRFHWYGRLAVSDAVTALGSGAKVTLTTPYGSAEGRLSDTDPWGRLRVTGVGRPPF